MCSRDRHARPWEVPADRVSHAGDAVIRISGMRDPSARYLLGDPAREVADLVGDHSVRRWRGSMAISFGLEGEVGASDLQTVLSGRSPLGTLKPSARRSVAAFDLIVAAPKPVSVLFASQDDSVARSVVESHEAAVGGALEYLERRACGIQRQTDNGLDRRWIHGDGMVAAAFTHGSSRSGDPHLHTHLLVANLVRGSDGRFGALDGRVLRAHVLAADSLYRSALRFELRTRLELRFDRTMDGVATPSSVDEGVCIALSGRSEEIRRGDRTRPPKSHQTRAEAMDRWEQRRTQAPVIPNSPRFHRPQDRLDEHRVSAVLDGRTLVARHLVEAIAEGATGGIAPDSVALVLRRSGMALGAGLHELPIQRSLIIPTKAQLRALGPRPTDHGDLDRWLDAASRDRRQIARTAEFGVDRSR